MAITFEEIMKFHPGNADVYEHMISYSSMLVPFVGAGMSRFAYPLWGEALSELSEKITDEAKRTEIISLIEDKKYLDAAQELENIRTPTNLEHDIACVFSPDKLSQKMDILPQQAVYLLPKLFPGLVLTTNFDETLETVYRNQNLPFDPISSPDQQDLLNQMLHNPSVRGLFKLHGTLNVKIMEYKKLVFTKKQYDKHYRKDSKLTKALRNCLRHRVMLFLGCSLDQDRTMDLLMEVKAPGLVHFAIISCDENERDNKVRELGERQIRAIVYPDGQHEAVRVILEHMLKEFSPYPYPALPPSLTCECNFINVLPNRAEYSKLANILNLGFEAGRRNPRSITCLGISNWIFTLDSGLKKLDELINKKVEINLFFLNPTGKRVNLRNKEEGRNIRRQILTGWDSLSSHFKNRNTDNYINCFMYDLVPRFNIIIIETETKTGAETKNESFAIVQSYSYELEGAMSPQMIISQDNEDLLKYYKSLCSYVKENSEKLHLSTMEYIANNEQK